MGPKLLFVLGIVVAHGALAAGWARHEAPKHRAPTTTCVKSPGSQPDFTPRLELLAMAVIPDHPSGEVMRQ